MLIQCPNCETLMQAHGRCPYCGRGAMRPMVEREQVVRPCQLERTRGEPMSVADEEEVNTMLNGIAMEVSR